MNRYISKIKKLKLVRKPAHNKEINGQIVTVQGKRIEFDAGYFETDDKEEIEFLENHKNLGKVFIKVPNVEEAINKRNEWEKTLADKERELAQREAELKKKELEIKPNEEGKTEKDEYEEMTVEELRKTAKELGLTQRGTKPQLIERIKEFKSKEDEPAYE